MEIPFWCRAGFRFKPFIKRMRRSPLDRDFVTHWKINIKIDTTKFLNLIFAARFLATEIIARHTQHNQTLIAVILPQCLQAVILLGETAIRGRVDDQ